MIRKLLRKDIDDDRWNSIIAASAYETIYPYTWYLDATADNWVGLVLNDYEFIMPLPFRKKYTVKYVYQPFHNQQLGVYSTKEITAGILELFIREMNVHFRMADYAFNAGNRIEGGKDLEIKESQNFVLSLNNDYEHIYSRYLGNVRRNLRKACKVPLELTEKLDIDDFVKLKRATNPSGQDEAFFMNMERYLKEMEKLGKVNRLGVSLQNELCAAGVFVMSNKRVIFILSGSNETGKKHSMMFYIVDRVIREYAGRDLIFDFEGSNIPSIADFFAGFGPDKEIYQRLYFNRLPIVGRSKKKDA